MNNVINIDAPEWAWNRSVAAQDKQLALSRTLAETAIARPDALRPGEVRDLGWGIMVALKRLAQLEAAAAPGRHPQAK